MPFTRAFLTSNRCHSSPIPHAPQSVRTVLVLGGAGYLGSVMVRRLLRGGFNVRVLDALLFGHSSLDEFKPNPNFELVRGDIRNLGAVERSMTGCQAVIHLAGIVGDAACDEQKSLALEVNSTATPTLAQAARQCGVHRFIFASSCSVYGASDSLLDELSPLNPLS